MAGRGNHYFEGDDVLNLKKAFEEVNKITDKFDYEYGSVSDYETDIDDDRTWAASVSFFALPKKEKLNEGVEKSMFTFLNDLRDSGITNMFGAGSYLEDEFGLDKREAREILAKWMRSFEEDKNEIDRDRIFMKGKVNEIKISSQAAELVDGYELEDLERNLEQIYRDMEQEAEPEGGPIADQYADEIHAHEEAIRFIKSKGKEQAQMSYDVAVGKITQDEYDTVVSKDQFNKSSQFDRMDEGEWTYEFGELDEDEKPSPERVSKMIQMHGKSKEEADKIVKQLVALGKKNPQKEQELTEKLCKKGEAYRKKRMAAGEKSSAYLSGRAVKVCKGDMKG
tara:strand:- start:695 stop:1708 length:1014 start_codon:yes stop_codon:yes gene_type:complete